MNRETATGRRRRLQRLWAAAAATVTVLGLSAFPASASSDSGSGQVQPFSMHRGTVGCFNWSYDDSGWESTTVYYHNTCNHRELLTITWARVPGTLTQWVYPGRHGSYKGSGDIVQIRDDGSKDW